MTLVSKFPQKYLLPYLHGQGFSGVIVSTFNVFTLAIRSDPEQSVLLYFAIGVIILLITMALLWYSSKCEAYKYYVETKKDDNNLKRTTFSEIKRTVKNIWPAITVSSITIGSGFALHPSITSLVVSEDYGKGYVWNGEC